MDQVVYMINKEIIEYHFETGWRTSVYKNVVEIKNEDIKVEAENDLQGKDSKGGLLEVKTK